MIVTIFKNIFSKEPHYIPVETALERIRGGKSKQLVYDIRNALDKSKSNNLKANLPSVCFSGQFGKDRKDDQLLKHSGFIVLDFDDLGDNLRERQTDIISQNFIYACWVSPSGNGLKALIKIADGSKHREHFQALQDIFPEIDKSGINVSRVCYESFDEDIYINTNAEVFKHIKKTEQIVNYIKQGSSSDDFKKILKWLTNRNDAFVTGERNTYIFKLAGACCRFGIDENEALSLISQEYQVSNDFTMNEMRNAIKSAYKSNRAKQGTAVFDKEKLITKTTKKEINVIEEFKPEYVEGFRVEDVVYGIDVKEKALSINQYGFAKVEGIDCPELDYLFKPKRGEPTLLTGIGNYGKSAFKKWYLLVRSIMFDEKVGTFSPEDTPPEEYFHDYVEMLLGCECNPYNPNRPSQKVYEAAYDYISKSLFYINSETINPTPQYIKQKFLELIVQEKIDYCVIDPFNQMTNDYKGYGGRTDKYLETLLADLTSFAQRNDIYLWIIAHPHAMKKIAQGTLAGNYEEPDVFDINDGAMWNNKMFNILVYHRPFAQTDPRNPLAIFASKKIKKKIVGRKGRTELTYDWDKRRFLVNGIDYIQVALQKKKLDFWNNFQNTNQQSSWDNDGVVDNIQLIDF